MIHNKQIFPCDDSCGKNKQSKGNKDESSRRMLYIYISREELSDEGTFEK